MKTIYLINLLFFITVVVNAQSPVLPIYDTPSGHGYANGEYYKDIQNDLDQFEGTWQYSNGNDLLVIKLKKLEMQHFHANDLNENYYTDILVGEYKYVTNGVEKVNTLDEFDVSYADADEHNLAGAIIEKYNPDVSGICIDCNPGEVEIGLSFSEPNVHISGSRLFYYFRHFSENGVEKIELNMIDRGMITHVKNGSISLNNEYSIPKQSYILTKVD